MSASEHITVRPALVGDAEAAVDLRVRVVDEGIWMGAEPPVDRVAAAAGFLDYVDSDDKGAFVAVADDVVAGDTVVGAVFVSFALPGVTTLGMNVDAAWRGRGIGRALVDEVIAWSRAREAHKIELEVWPHNLAAIGLYESTGFEREGLRRRQYRRRNGELWDAVVMGLVLDTESPGCTVP